MKAGGSQHAFDTIDFFLNGETFQQRARVFTRLILLPGERQMRDGLRHEASFCVVCGVSVLSRLEVFPGLVGVSVGCFTDPAFEPPRGFYWASRRHTWLPVPIGVEVFQTQ